MCGDGTNDVGALKHAHIGESNYFYFNFYRYRICLNFFVGVALLSNAPAPKQKQIDKSNESGNSQQQNNSSKRVQKSIETLNPPVRAVGRQQKTFDRGQPRGIKNR